MPLSVLTTYFWTQVYSTSYIRLVTAETRLQFVQRLHLAFRPTICRYCVGERVVHNVC